MKNLDKEIDLSDLEEIINSIPNLSDRYNLQLSSEFINFCNRVSSQITLAEEPNDEELKQIAQILAQYKN